MLPILNYISLSNVLLTLAILLIIAGIPMAFSKTERERMQKRVMTELPERSAYLGSPEAMQAARRRGVITLAIGFVLFLLWLITFQFGL